MLWILNQFINLIIMLNFLIALISEVYASVMEKQQSIIYSNKAEMNKEFYMSERFWKSLKPIKLLVFTSDKELLEQDEGDEHQEMLANNFKEINELINKNIQDTAALDQKVETDIIPRHA